MTFLCISLQRVLELEKHSDCDVDVLLLLLLSYCHILSFNGAVGPSEDFISQSSSMYISRESLEIYISSARRAWMEAGDST